MHLAMLTVKILVLPYKMASSWVWYHRTEKRYGGVGNMPCRFEGFEVAKMGDFAPNFVSFYRRIFDLYLSRIYHEVVKCDCSII